MINFNNIPSQFQNNQIFKNSNGSWQLWNKPANIKFIYILAVGGGGGGGGGRTSALNSACGGGGGGSSSISVGLFPANFLPDSLYVQIGAGGIGGATNTSGGNGSLSYVCFQPDVTNLINLLIKSGDTAATGGGGGSSSIAGTAGTGGVAFTFANDVYGNIGQFTSSNGQSGAVGGALGGSTPSLTPSSPITGGAGGGAVSAGGTTFTAGAITGSGFLNSVIGGIANSVTASINGSSGYSNIGYINTSFDFPMFSTGGAGGGSTSTNALTAGIGGDGFYGSGGGGGGAAYSATGGKGGNGGDGFVIITCM